MTLPSPPNVGSSEPFGWYASATNRSFGPSKPAPPATMIWPSLSTPMASPSSNVGVGSANTIPSPPKAGSSEPSER